MNETCTILQCNLSSDSSLKIMWSRFEALAITDITYHKDNIHTGMKGNKLICMHVILSIFTVVYTK